MFIQAFTRSGALASSLLASVLLSSAAAAQSRLPASDPGDAGARVAAFVHQPLFRDYQSAHEVSLGSWREANDTVGRIGGWRAYAREANADAERSGEPAAPAQRGTGQPAAPSAPVGDSPAGPLPSDRGVTHRHPAGH